MSSPSEYNQGVIEEFRANHGKVGGQFGGMPIVLLTTTGAKSGKQRTNPLAYFRDGDRVVILASKGGAPTNPDWYYNLLANPLVTVEIGDETYQARASVVEGEERERIFRQVAEQAPGFGDYQRNTTRQIPVVILTRSDAA